MLWWGSSRVQLPCKSYRENLTLKNLLIVDKTFKTFLKCLNFEVGQTHTTKLNSITHFEIIKRFIITKKIIAWCFKST
jgi:hypothetical protein